MKANDVDLIRRVLDGDQGAFTALVNKYQKSVHALVWRKIGDFHIAEEITQDVFLKVYKRLSTLKRPELFPGWLYVIATRDCVSWLRKKELPTKSLDAMSTVELEEICYAQYEANCGEAAAVEHQREFVKRLLQKLPESERTVVTLYYLAEMKSEDISAFLGVSSNTVRSRLRRARERLEKEEFMVQEVLGNFQIPTNLTENITREIVKIKPISPSVSKPWLPWGLSFASTFLVLLMVGMGPRALSRFQQPYNLDATAEMTVELVDAPVVFELKREIDVKNQFGKSNTPGRGSGTDPRANTGLLAAAHADTVERHETKPQWIQKKGPVGGHVNDLFVSAQKEVYAIGDIGLYRLTGDDKSEWTLINDSLPSIYAAKSMAERGDTLYLAAKTHVLKSTDRGVAWEPLGERPQGYTVALLITDPTQMRRPQDAQIEMYLVLSKGVFRSIDAGNTWHLFNAGLTIPNIQDAAAIENVLFLTTKQGFYRLDSGVWKKVPGELPPAMNSLAVADNRIYLSSSNKVDPQSRLLHTSLFTSDDFGDSWTDITPPMQAFSLPVKLVAIDKTVLVLGVGTLRSTDAGNTWEDLGYQKHAFAHSSSPAIALDENTFFVATVRSVGRTIDGGENWEPWTIGIAETHVHDLVQVNGTLYATTRTQFVKSVDGGEQWTPVGINLPLPENKALIDLGLSNMTAAENSLFVRAKQGGSTNSLFYSVPGIDTLLHIKDIPAYVVARHGEWLESIADATVVLQLDEEERTGLAHYLLGIKEAATRTTGEFAISEDTFYIEYEHKLYRCSRGDHEWFDTGMQDAPVFDGFYATNGFQVAASEEVVYLGKSDGTLFQSVDSGTTWKDVTASFPLPLDRTVSRTELLEKLPHFKEILFVGSTVYVSTGNGVGMSNDGENWRVLTDAEQIPITMRHLAIDGTTLYGVTQTSAYRLQKNTRTWIQIVPEIPERVTSLVAAGNILYVGTEHRGVLELPLQ
ncbi:MAG: sigma-70 family RNA polymerase sigma factor [Candidatus Poribacteria bacterium]|nr:sigma-70 family RNA polymerase sigma factor [Candidatus Poribacteria bacterium]